MFLLLLCRSLHFSITIYSSEIHQPHFILISQLVSSFTNTTITITTDWTPWGYFCQGWHPPITKSPCKRQRPSELVIISYHLLWMFFSITHLSLLIELLFYSATIPFSLLVVCHWPWWLSQVCCCLFQGFFCAYYIQQRFYGGLFWIIMVVPLSNRLHWQKCS